MKRLFDKQFLRSKWVVPASALILTLSIGSFALAGTGTGDNYSSTPSSSTTASTQPAVAQPAETQPAAAAPSMTFAPTTQSPTAGGTTPLAALATSDVQLQQAKENAILDLIREKMAPEDQVVFDQLRATAAQEQLAITKAQMDLQATKAEITALIDKYLGVPEGVTLGVAPAVSTTVTSDLRLPRQ